MTPQPNPARFEPHDDPIDVLLAQARWPEPAPRSERRLLAVWEASWQRQRARRYLPWVAAVAASLLLAVGFGWKLHLSTALSPVQISRTSHEAVLPEIRPAALNAADEETIPSRPANLYERLVLTSRKTQAKPAESGVAHVAPPPVIFQNPAGPIVRLKRAEQESARRIASTGDHAVRRELLGKLIASGTPAGLEAFLQLMVTPACRDDALRVLQTPVARPDPALLFARFNDARVDCRFAAAKALGMMCDARVRAQLYEMVRTNFHRREALAALLCCGDDDAASFLKAARANPSLSAQLGSVRGEINRLF